MRCDILNAEWASTGRDINIIEPILVYLEMKYGLRVERISIADFEYALLRLKPRMVVIASGAGADINVEVMKLASKLSFKVVSLISEGDYPDDLEGTKEFFWQWNHDGIFYETLHLEWTERNLELIQRHIPGSNDYNIKVSGATGFDKYRIWSYTKKKDFLAKYQMERFGRVVGIAGWGFDALFGEYFERNTKAMETRLGSEYISLHRKSKELLKNIYRQIIEKNPDTLFVLKHHPSVIDEQSTELYGLNEYNNVLSIIGRSEDIGTVINISDIWIAYESTTCLEAWLMKKQTLLVNPLGGNFRRSRISAGSPINTNLEQVQHSLDNFYKNGLIPGFAELAPKRQRIIREIIQWDDGKNHIRAAEYIYQELLLSDQKTKSYDLWLCSKLVRAGLAHIAFRIGIQDIWPVSRMVAGRKYLKSIYDFEEREEIRKKYASCLQNFYSTNGISVIE